MPINENAPLVVVPGAIRFNTDSMKLEYYRGGPVGFGTTTTTGEWVNLTTDSPDIQTGGARGVFGGGRQAPVATIDYINISSTGNAISFGSLTGSYSIRGACASSTRGVWSGGYSPSPGSSPFGRVNVIDYVTISSTGNAIDFGDTTGGTKRQGQSGFSNSTRGIFTSGYEIDFFPAAYRNTLDYITIASTGNAINFGNISAGACSANATCASSTRGIIAGGESPVTNIINFVTISTLGNTADFGDLTKVIYDIGGCSNATRGVLAGGYVAPVYVNTIDYITISTLGNAVSFGTLTTATRGLTGACASSTRGVWGGGYVTPAATNIIDYVNITTTGNAIDFGDLTSARYHIAGLSNGHGGLG
jgi:hypothetical protein